MKEVKIKMGKVMKVVMMILMSKKVKVEIKLGKEVKVKMKMKVEKKKTMRRNMLKKKLWKKGPVQRIAVRPRQEHQEARSQKALSPGLGDKASAVKMTDNVLKHLTVIGSGGPSGTTTLGGTQPQPITYKRKATVTATRPSIPQGKKSRN
ncbi:hypothetical protein Scep_001420 [Stephania cephalantha]|uniref:Uncharacterized protein n=1 Tax=Stephania cephalantha TaxID=152367 RepID=A0AAP0LBZ1_9MAGN